MTKHYSHPTDSKQLRLPETISFITSTTNHYTHCQPCRTNAAMQLLTSHYSHAANEKVAQMTKNYTDVTNKKAIRLCHTQTIQ